MTYFGGKAQEGVYQTIINQIPWHRVYIEPFLGGGAIMLKKRPAELNIGIDLDAKALLDFRFPPKSEHLEHQVDRLIHGDALAHLRAFALEGELTPDTFIYCDPPYPLETRSCNRCRYLYELTELNHRVLLSIIKDLTCMVMISTYPNDLYESELTGWRKLEYQAVVRSGDVRTELLYMNYPEPEYLHDDRYIGVNANNRQDINRRIARTVRRICLWPRPEWLKYLRKLLAKLPAADLEYLRCSIGDNARRAPGIDHPGDSALATGAEGRNALPGSEGTNAQVLPVVSEGKRCLSPDLTPCFSVPEGVLSVNQLQTAVSRAGEGENA